MENLKQEKFDLNQALETAGVVNVDVVSANRCFGGLHLRLKHYAESLKCDMIVGVYIPPSLLTDEAFKTPALYWLAGLTCTDQNFLQKAGAMRTASELGLVLICPDTSPRGDGVPDADAYDMGQGAGFYLNATQEPWAKNYQMYDYVACELVAWCEKHLPITSARSLCGHSMGGHGALTIAFKNPGTYRSVSALAPICNPCNVPWGQKALANYLGEDKQAWVQYDAMELLANARERLPLLIDQGTDDEFLAQLKTQDFAKACKQHKHPAVIRMQDGYDHSYFFIATFIDDHIHHHARALGLTS
ncbi:MAG: S-formylglutathione hydrolase [Gammaproteobacteria bacterium]|nr:S-formylglutathione hydrolase [Gammaproteobacteria bacterium]